MLINKKKRVFSSLHITYQIGKLQMFYMIDRNKK